MRNAVLGIFVGIMITTANSAYAFEFGEWQCETNSGSKATITINDTSFMLTHHYEKNFLNGKSYIVKEVKWTEKSLPTVTDKSGPFKGYSSSTLMNYNISSDPHGVMKFEQLTMYDHKTLSFKYEEAVVSREPKVTIGQYGEIESVTYREHMLAADSINYSNCKKIK